MISRFALTLVVLVLAATIPATAESRIDWMEKVYADGEHNAFTDLVRWKDRFYLCFRHGTGHGSMDGEIRVMRSDDMKTWTPCGTLSTDGDDRDPHFAVTDDTLYVYFGTWSLVHQPGHALPSRGEVRSYFATSADGETWSKIQAVYEPGFWMWRVRHHDGVFYSAAYTAVRPKPDTRETRLVRSEDGLNWELLSVVTTERMAGEADMLFFPDDTMWLISRTGDEAGDAVWFRGDASKTQWTGADTGVLIHSPAIAQWKDRYFISGRGRGDDGMVTKLWELYEDGRIEERLTLPSGGDTAYPGLIVDESSLGSGTPALFVTWYSQHEREQEPVHTKDTSSIYAARVVIEE